MGRGAAVFIAVVSSATVGWAEERKLLLVLDDSESMAAPLGKELHGRCEPLNPKPNGIENQLFPPSSFSSVAVTTFSALKDSQTGSPSEGINNGTDLLRYLCRVCNTKSQRCNFKDRDTPLLEALRFAKEHLREYDRAAVVTDGEPWKRNAQSERLNEPASPVDCSKIADKDLRDDCNCFRDKAKCFKKTNRMRYVQSLADTQEAANILSQASSGCGCDQIILFSLVDPEKSFALKKMKEACERCFQTSAPGSPGTTDWTIDYEFDGYVVPPDRTPACAIRTKARCERRDLKWDRSLRGEFRCGNPTPTPDCTCQGNPPSCLRMQRCEAKEEPARCNKIQNEYECPDGTAPMNELPEPWASRLSTLRAANPEYRLNSGRAGPANANSDVVVALARDARPPHCSGVAITKDAVLTARHCLPVTEVLVGNDARRPRFRAPALEVVEHPDPRFDLAVLRVLPLPINETVSLADARPSAVASLLVVGFGGQDRTGMTAGRQRRGVYLPAQELACTPARAPSGCVPGVDLVVASDGTRDSCSGDSGGALWALSDQQSCSYRLLGIVSHGFPLGAPASCGTGGVYTDVRQAVDWLRMVIRKP